MFDFNTLPEGKRRLRKVQLGAGNTNSEDYINTDFYQMENTDLQLNLSEKFPFDDNTIEEFYSHHVLEHIYITNIDLLFKEIYRCLNTNGRFISVLPDFEKAALQFIKGENLYNSTGSIWGCATLGWKPKEAHQHVYGWTKNSLTNKLKEHNFRIKEIKQTGEDITVLSFIAMK